MRIGELAHQTGLTTKTIRYYEQIGLMHEPDRHANGYRKYGDYAVERLRSVRDAQAAGLTLAEAGEILGMKAAGESTCSHTTEILSRHLADVDAQIDRLLATRNELRAMAERAEALDPSSCNDPARCQVIGATAAQEGLRPRPASHQRLLPLA
ncbi:MerR family transcriptional regulator [Demequina sp. TTPB684]|uniref:MerR family transcriptional regulator n=1 Tax=unclassified Demequina TaxID=2620311 RepID=UPI001CF57CB3|nr:MULTISPECIES: MerR family transcriptional regulator [unclassified Demequina]MCB2411342.1 MerR family transcriptional regulator [Demequina sp. TTPB684]UPU87651.1 MerR family transcriptional regulator [Demequina sp. TMPB413]